MSSAPRILPHPKLKTEEELVHVDPIETYMHGYFDASNDMLRALTSFVTTLRITGWDDKDILKALLTALKNYSTGEGLEKTTMEVMRTYPGKGRLLNGKQSQTSKL